MVHLNKMYQIEWVSEWMNGWWHRWSAQYNPTMWRCDYVCACASLQLLWDDNLANCKRIWVCACVRVFAWKRWNTHNWLLNKQNAAIDGTHRDENRCIRFWKLSENQCHFRFDTVKEILFTWNKRFCYWYSCCFWLLLFFVIVAIYTDRIAFRCDAMAMTMAWHANSADKLFSWLRQWHAKQCGSSAHTHTPRRTQHLKWIQLQFEMNTICVICVCV